MMLATEYHDEVLPTTWHSRRGDFVSLMTLYESNYVRLLSMVPQLSSMTGEQISTLKNDCSLYLRIEEHSRYTTTFILTYKFATVAGDIADPNLLVRAYHDAHLAEVMHCSRWHRHQVLASIKSAHSELNERWLRNMMLNKWLDYCADRGHRFALS